MIQRIGLLLVCALAVCAAPAAASSWDAPAARLGREVAAIAGPGTASLSIRNQSSLPTDEIPAIRRALEAELRTHGIQLRSANDAANVIRVTLSENLQGWLWVAEVRQGDDVKVAMVPVARASAAPSAQGGPSVILRKSLIFSQSDQILDAVTIPSASDARLAVLSASTIALYRSSAGKWEQEQTFPVVHSRPFPLDLRGRLFVDSNGVVTAFLPGVVCSGNSTGTGGVACHDSDDPWPFGVQKAFFNSARNYFTGVLVPGLGKQINPFYSAADLPRNGYTLWVFAGVDGAVREHDGMNERTITPALTRDWGSDVAVVFSHCGNGAQLLVTGAGDEADSIRAFEIPDREPVLVSAPLAMEGEITALWASADAASATAVVHNSSTGQYEAYSVSVACSR